MQINLDEYEVIEAVKEYAAKKVNLAITDSVNGEGWATIHENGEHKTVPLGAGSLSISIELGEGEE